MRTPIYFRRGNKVDLPVLNAGEPGFATDTKELYIGASGGNIALPNKTIANLTYFVDTALGNDANDGLAAGAGRALKTIQAAINKLPQIINHTVTIIVAAGTYAEDVVISGFLGKGTIFLQASVTNTLSDSYIVQSISIQQCSLYVEVNSLKGSSTTKEGFLTVRSNHANITYCKVDAASASSGFSFDASICRVVNCLVSNRGIGISAGNGSTIISSNNSGTGNTTGLVSQSASTIGKNGTQPAGTTAESSTSGGVIR